MQLLSCLVLELGRNVSNLQGDDNRLTDTIRHIIAATGVIHLEKNESFIGKGQSTVDILVERKEKLEGKVEAKWKVQNISGLNGSIIFKDKDHQQVITLDLRNVSRKQLIRIELFEPSHGYQLGENKVANISFVCKLILRILHLCPFSS